MKLSRIVLNFEDGSVLVAHEVTLDVQNADLHLKPTARIAVCIGDKLYTTDALVMHPLATGPELSQSSDR